MSAAMGQLIRLADYLENREPRAATAPEREESRDYYCTRCRGESFRLGHNGDVSCARCSALITNIRVTKRRPR